MWVSVFTTPVCFLPLLGLRGGGQHWAGIGSRGQRAGDVCTLPSGHGSPSQVGPVIHSVCPLVTMGGRVGDTFCVHC